MNDGRDDTLDLSRIAHDLRGPLMPLRTAAWLLRNELGESARACELAAIVERQSARLARMLDELGDWGRGTDAALARERVALDPALALDMAIGAIPGCASEPRFLDGAAGCRLYADPHRLGQLLATLLEHAMHRAGGRAPGIEVSADDGEVWIRVMDDGPELDPAACAALLFQPQARAFDEGLGLRLLLARRIAEAHGGSLAAEARTGGGLVLACRLPAAG